MGVDEDLSGESDGIGRERKDAAVGGVLRDRLLSEEYLGLIEELGGDAQGRFDARDYMEHSTATYAGKVINTSYVPKLFDLRTREVMRRAAETMHGILCKVVEAYRGDEAVRRLFDVDGRLEGLMLLDSGYGQPIPFARLDAFVDEDTGRVRFCEFNTDGSSGMNENREATNSLAEREPMRGFCERHRVRDCNGRLFEGWVAEFLRIYRSSDYAASLGADAKVAVSGERRALGAAAAVSVPDAVEQPHVAVVDYLENSVVTELAVYARLFEEAGCRFSVYDVRDLAFDGERLTCEKPQLGYADLPIDAIWRRSVASDVLAHWDESGAYLDAVRAGKVCLIGPFATNVAHDKQIFALLRHPRIQALLTEGERAFVEETVPFTAVLSRDLPSFDDIVSDPARWIVKPTDMYGSLDVFAGPDYAGCPQEWARIVDEHCRDRVSKPYLVQEFVVPWKSPAIPLRGEPGDLTSPVQQFNNLSGFYVIDGRFAGVFSRLGPEPIILGSHGGVTAPSLWVDDVQ